MLQQFQSETFARSRAEAYYRQRNLLKYFGAWEQYLRLKRLASVGFWCYSTKSRCLRALKQNASDERYLRTAVAINEGFDPRPLLRPHSASDRSHGGVSSRHRYLQPPVARPAASGERLHRGYDVESDEDSDGHPGQTWAEAANIAADVYESQHGGWDPVVDAVTARLARRSSGGHSNATTHAAAARGYATAARDAWDPVADFVGARMTRNSSQGQGGVAAGSSRGGAPAAWGPPAVAAGSPLQRNYSPSGSPRRGFESLDGSRSPGGHSFVASSATHGASPGTSSSGRQQQSFAFTADSTPAAASASPLRGRSPATSAASASAASFAFAAPACPAESGDTVTFSGFRPCERAGSQPRLRGRSKRMPGVEPAVHAAAEALSPQVSSNTSVSLTSSSDDASPSFNPIRAAADARVMGEVVRDWAPPDMQVAPPPQHHQPPGSPPVSFRFSAPEESADSSQATAQMWAAAPSPARGILKAHHGSQAGAFPPSTPTSILRTWKAPRPRAPLGSAGGSCYPSAAPRTLTA